MTLVLLSTLAIAIVMSLMAVGVLLSNRCLRGSCGGPEVFGPDGESLACAACPQRRERQRGDTSSTPRKSSLLAQPPA